MTEREWALLMHLTGVVLLFGGTMVAAAAQAGARRQDRPGEIAALLVVPRGRLMRPARAARAPSRSSSSTGRR